MFNKDGTFIRRIGKADKSSGGYRNPSRVCITSRGQIFVYDQDKNAVLFYDSLANLLCFNPLREMNIYQCGVSGDRVITVGTAYCTETSAAAYYWSNCDTNRIAELIDTYDYPKYLRMVLMQYQIPVLSGGDFCLLDEGTFRVTKFSKDGNELQVSEEQPKGFLGPEHDLVALDNEEAHIVAEKADAIIGFCYASGCLIVIWWDHHDFFVEIYDENLVHKVTRVAIPDSLYPLVSSDGTHLYFIVRQNRPGKTSPLRNPTLAMFSLSSDKVLQRGGPK
jgi:hypothetical protein